MIATPGPWAARPWRFHSPTTIVREVAGDVVSVIAEVDPVDGYGTHPGTIANASLIAAAPELLEALRELMAADAQAVRCCADKDAWSAAHDRRLRARALAERAMEKAEGRS